MSITGTGNLVIKQSNYQCLWFSFPLLYRPMKVLNVKTGCDIIFHEWLPSEAIAKWGLPVYRAQETNVYKIWVVFFLYVVLICFWEREFSVLRKIGDVRFTGQRGGNDHQKTLLLNCWETTRQAMRRDGGWGGVLAKDIAKDLELAHTLQFHGIVSICCQNKESSRNSYR